MRPNSDRSGRQLRFTASNFRAENRDGPVIEGYFSVFNSDYVYAPGYRERVAPGAFSESLLTDDIRALIDHETRLVLGRTIVGTLILREDEHGLFGTIKINEADSDAMNLYARVQRGDVSQCSFGFDILDEERVEDPNGTILYIIRKVKLWEVSVVTFPAYTETSVEARKRDEENARRRELAAWKETMKERIKK